MRKGICGVLLGIALVTVTNGRSAEIGHYIGGLANIRDYIVPDPGFYTALYNYYYTADRLNDANGNRVSSINFKGPGPGLTLNIDADADIYALAPMILWVSPWKFAGAKYAAYAVPNFANSSVGASLSTLTGPGVGGQESHFDIGDAFFQPLWLGWTKKHWDIAFGYGFYAPIGRYETEVKTFPVIGSQRIESKDNVGLGFWTHQIQGGLTWYPSETKGTAINATLTYEIHQKKQDFDLTPGQDLTLNWGISQYVPLRKDQKVLLEVGVGGYSSWQITDDSGSAARNPAVHDEVHAIGGQIGLTHVAWGATLNFHYFYEFSSKDRFQGEVFGLNLAKKF